MRGRATAISMGAFAAFVLTVFAWIHSGQTTSVTKVLLISIDTLRADHLGSYGYPRKTSPVIDSLAARGVQFERALSPMATTVPAHGTMFTALYPRQIGLLKNGHRLAGEFETLAEVLQVRGFQSVGFSSTNRHFLAAGLAQGFAHFDEPREAVSYRPAPATVDVVLNWLKSNQVQERLFLFVHLFDPHLPRLPSEPLLGEIREPTVEGRARHRDFILTGHHASADYFALHQQDPLDVIDPYDAEIFLVDREVGRLLDRMERQGLLDETLVIVVGDHGEGLGNHDWLTHGKNIYNEQLHVPLIVWSSSSGVPAGRKVSAVVELSDLMPTILQLVGITDWGSGQARTGESLVGLMDGTTRSRRKEYAFAQRRTFAVREDPVDDGDKYEAGEKFAIQIGTKKLIHRTHDADELFDLLADPYETNNLAEIDPATTAELRAALAEVLRDVRPAVATEPAKVDSDTIEGLKALGYIQ